MKEAASLICGAKSGAILEISTLLCWIDTRELGAKHRRGKSVDIRTPRTAQQRPHSTIDVCDSKRFFISPYGVQKY